MKPGRGGEAEAPLYLVTGGAGFIGSHIVETLAISGQRVRVLDDFSAGTKDNLAAFADGIEVMEGSVTDPEACAKSCEAVDYVLHHAARVSVQESWENPVLYEEVNALGTLRMIAAAREAGCRRFVYAGSASAYGSISELPHREDMTPDPLSPYAVAKHAGELYCRAFHDPRGLETVVLRYFNVFGPRQRADSPYSGVIARFVRGLLAGKEVTVLGDGEQSRDFVAVENVVEANLLACTAPEAAGQIINIGCGEQMTVNCLADVLIELTGAGCTMGRGPARPGEVRHSAADISRARRLLGYRVNVSVPDGLRRTVAWYRTAYAGESHS